MARPDDRARALIDAFAGDVHTALGDRLVCVVLHGSAAGDDWSPERSDVNTAIVTDRLTLAELERLAPVVTRYRPKGFAAPVLMDGEFLRRARDTFPMELDDIHRQHRLLIGRDAFAALEVSRTALRTECEREARGKLLRLRALSLDALDRPDDLERLMVESLKTFLIVLRHVARLRGTSVGQSYRDALCAGEAVIGPLPVMQRLLAHRDGERLGAAKLRAELGAYLAEVERIVAVVDGLDA